MPTLDQAARQLGMSEKTLRRWMRLLDPPVTWQKHRYDMRYRHISPEDVERIRQERATLPQHAPVTPSYTPVYTGKALRGDSDGSMVRDVSPTFAPAPRQRPLQRDAIRVRSDGLPEGMMSRTDVADLHGFPRSTLRRWCDEGRIETAPETYGGEHGQFVIARPVTTRGLAQFYALASRRADFTPCEHCPHEEAE